MLSSIFLSYSRSDLEIAHQIRTLFQERDVQVWFDQESIYTGEKWPKAVGEGIARQTLLMLLWSKDAAKSHFVEFEWNTALALKKIIVPVLLDNAPLPPSLQAIQAIQYDSLLISIDSVLKKVEKASLQQAKPRREVLDRLNEIQTQSPHAVLAEAKTIYQQEGWTVQNFYQIHGENVSIHAPSDNPSAPKKWYELWQTYIALIAGVLGILVILLDLPKKWREAFPTEVEALDGTKPEEVVETISLKGTILNENKEPVRGAVVKLDKLPGDSVVTSSDGGFVFREVPGQIGEDVRVYVYASGYHSRDEYKAIPGPIELRLEKNKPH